MSKALVRQGPTRRRRARLAHGVGSHTPATQDGRPHGVDSSRAVCAGTGGSGTRPASAASAQSSTGETTPCLGELVRSVTPALCGSSTTRSDNPQGSATACGVVVRAQALRTRHARTESRRGAGGRGGNHLGEGRRIGREGVRDGKTRAPAMPFRARRWQRRAWLPALPRAAALRATPEASAPLEPRRR